MDDRLKEWVYFLLDQHLEQMTAIAVELGDELVNVKPDLPGANTAYQIVTHCFGVIDWWTRHAIGLDVTRDRAAEFVAAGPASTLRERAAAVRGQLLDDLSVIDLEAAPKADLSDYAATLDFPLTAHGVLMHVFEELAQHHGHLELTRDLLLR